MNDVNPNPLTKKGRDELREIKKQADKSSQESVVWLNAISKAGPILLDLVEELEGMIDTYQKINALMSSRLSLLERRISDLQSDVKSLQRDSDSCRICGSPSQDCWHNLGCGD